MITSPKSTATLQESAIFFFINKNHVEKASHYFSPKCKHTLTVLDFRLGTSYTLIKSIFQSHHYPLIQHEFMWLLPHFSLSLSTQRSFGEEREILVSLNNLSAAETMKLSNWQIFGLPKNTTNSSDSWRTKTSWWGLVVQNFHRSTLGWNLNLPGL